MPCSDLSMVKSLFWSEMRWSLAFEAWGETLTSSDEAWYCEQQKMKRKHIKVLSHTKTDKDPQFIYFAPGSCQTQSYTWWPGGRESCWWTCARRPGPLLWNVMTAKLPFDTASLPLSDDDFGVGKSLVYFLPVEDGGHVTHGCAPPSSGTRLQHHLNKK